jgi:hypothetical protein
MRIVAETLKQGRKVAVERLQPDESAYQTALTRCFPGTSQGVSEQADGSDRACVAAAHRPIVRPRGYRGNPHMKMKYNHIGHSDHRTLRGGD